MKEAAISQSPYVINPEIFRDEKEVEKLYKLRIDETYRPYTIFDVLSKVFRRSYSDDLLSYIGEHPEEFMDFEDGWKLARAWVNELYVLRSEAGFFQNREDFRVDIEVEVKIKLEEARKDVGIFTRRESLKGIYRLRYSFDFTPCKLLCRFIKVVTKKEESPEAVWADSLRLDKYLLPVMQSKDYADLAAWIHKDCYAGALRDDAKIDPLAWIDQMERTVRCGMFPENGALGEYFFGFGTADIVDQKTGMVRNERIDPGTIILNWELTKYAGMMNSTLAHEATHAFLGQWFFRLQMTHGHDYCSYMCKKSGIGVEPDYHSPLERMEIQANTLPRYLLIPETNGKKHAEELMQSYGGERSLENMQRLVDDMAAYYETTKTMARSRLMDFGYNEVRGILRSANGKLVPAAASQLKQYYWDKKSYEYAGRQFWGNEDSLYSESAEVSALVIEEGYITIRDFASRCKVWLDNREANYQAWVKNMKQQEMQAVIEALEKELREKEAKEKPLPPTQEESMATVLEKNNNSSIAEALHIEAVPFENEKEEKNICGLDLREYNTILYRIRQILVDEKVWANSGCTQHDCFFK